MPHTVSWLGAYTPIKAWRFDSSYPDLVLYKGDDVQILFTPAMRTGDSWFNYDGFQRVPVDVTGAKIIARFFPLDPRNTTDPVITKTTATGGGITIGVDEYSNPLVTIALAAADTAAIVGQTYRGEVRARFVDPVTAAVSIGILGAGPVHWLDTAIGATDFALIP